MAIRFTVDVFSGRPNPVFTIDGPEADEVLQRLGPGERLGERDAAPPPESVLGYRGLIVEQVPRRARNLPTRFRVVDGKLFGPRLARHAADAYVEDFVVGPEGPIRIARLSAEVLAALGAELERRRGIDWRWPPLRWPSRVRCRCAPLYEPDWWNDAASGGARQYSNNCYNYATNYRTDTFAQPGLAAGQEYTSPIACSGVRAGAVADDLIDNPSADNRCPEEGHLVALVVAPGVDFHWYRKGRNGHWTHKPGGTPATNVDNSGAIILDPRTADRGIYTDFCTFMTVMHGHIKLQ